MLLGREPGRNGLDDRSLVNEASWVYVAMRRGSCARVVRDGAEMESIRMKYA